MKRIERQRDEAEEERMKELVRKMNEECEIALQRQWEDAEELRRKSLEEMREVMRKEIHDEMEQYRLDSIKKALEEAEVSSKNMHAFVFLDKLFIFFLWFNRKNLPSVNCWPFRKHAMNAKKKPTKKYDSYARATMHLLKFFYKSAHIFYFFYYYSHLEVSEYERFRVFKGFRFSYKKRTYSGVFGTYQVFLLQILIELFIIYRKIPFLEFGIKLGKLKIYFYQRT